MQQIGTLLPGQSLRPGDALISNNGAYRFVFQTDGNLVIERKALAKAVRSTTDFDGVTCTITLDAASGNRLDDQASLARCGG